MRGTLCTDIYIISVLYYSHHLKLSLIHITLGRASNEEKYRSETIQCAVLK